MVYQRRGALELRVTFDGDHGLGLTTADAHSAPGDTKLWRRMHVDLLKAITGSAAGLADMPDPSGVYAWVHEETLRGPQMVLHRLTEGATNVGDAPEWLPLGTAAVGYLHRHADGSQVTGIWVTPGGVDEDGLPTLDAGQWAVVDSSGRLLRERMYTLPQPGTGDAEMSVMGVLQKMLNSTVAAHRPR